jgi:hypothetical protein
MAVNCCALVVASVVAAAGTYLVHECYGRYRPTDFFVYFIPVLAMFVIRNLKFSYFFLALSFAPASQISYRALRIHTDFQAACGGRFEDPIGLLQPALFLISIASLAIYAAVALLNLAASNFRSRND